MPRLRTRLAKLRTIGGVLVVVGLLLGIYSGLATAQVATIAERGVKLSDSIPGHQSAYNVFLRSPAVPTLGSIKVEFCENSPLFSQPCDPPGGFTLAGAILSDQSGDVGFTIDPSSTASVLILKRTPGASLGTPSEYTLQNVTNATALGTQYARFTTYASNDATGPIQDLGAVAYVLNVDSSLVTEVAQYLDFCVATTINSTDCSDLNGSYLGLGDFSPNAAATGQLQMVVGTNAGNGYMVSIDGNPMASGNNVLPPLTVPTASAPGNSQFGINLRANTSPASGANPSGVGGGTPTADYNIPNRFTFRSGDVIASRATTEDYRKYTVTYLVNISKKQEPGIYAGTYTYVTLGNF